MRKAAMMPLTEPSFPQQTLAVEPWPDPVIDRLGHDPRSTYVERFWLGVLGPSTLWLLRRVADELDRHPEGFTLNLAETARAIGIGMRGGRNSPFMRSIERSCRFGAARFVGAGKLAVRRKLPPLTRQQALRLPESLQREHQTWLERGPGPNPTGATVDDLRERARGLALSMLDLGEDLEAAERQLHRWHFHPALAHDALRWAVAHRRETTTPCTPTPPAAGDG
jgi:hypothetical protein